MFLLLRELQLIYFMGQLEGVSGLSVLQHLVLGLQRPQVLRIDLLSLVGEEVLLSVVCRLLERLAQSALASGVLFHQWALQERLLRPVMLESVVVVALDSH